MKKGTRIIAIANHKGGVGKTTTTASMGAILSQKGFHVLLIDLDAQANLTCSLLKQEVTTSVYNAFVESTDLPIYNIGENLDLVPSSLQLAQADLQLGSALARERLLEDHLSSIKERYDYILIDCPPSLSLMTLNAITAANEVIIPLVAETLPFKGLTMITNFVKMVKAKLNPKVDVEGVLITRYEKSNLSKQIENGLRESLGDLVYKTKIRKNITVAQAPLEATNIVDYDKNSNGAIDYVSFTDEYLARTAAD